MLHFIILLSILLKGSVGKDWQDRKSSKGVR
jgi:hypothetical protein